MNLQKGHNTRYSKVYRIKGERTCDPVGCQIQKTEVDTLRAETFQFHVGVRTGTSKYTRFGGLNLTTYLDDASRCVTGARLFKKATSEKAAVALRQAINEFGTCYRTVR